MLSCIDSTNHASGVQMPEASIETNNNPSDLRRTLQDIFQGHSFGLVMATLAKVCGDRATQVREETRDEVLAQSWLFNQRQCKRVANAAKPTEPTSSLRYAKLGLEAGEIERRIATLPEPQRSIVRDYFTGVIPVLGKETALRALVNDACERIKAVEVSA